MARSRDGRSIARDDVPPQHPEASSSTKQQQAEKPKEKYHMHIVRTTETLTSEKRDHINEFLGGSTRIIPVDFQGSAFPSDEDNTIAVPSLTSSTPHPPPTRRDANKAYTKRKAQDTEEEGEEPVVTKRRRGSSRGRATSERETSSMDENEAGYRQPRKARADRDKSGSTAQAAQPRTQNRGGSFHARSSDDEEEDGDYDRRKDRGKEKRYERVTTPPRHRPGRDGEERDESQHTPRKAARGVDKHRGQMEAATKDKQKDRTPTRGQPAHRPEKERDDRVNWVRERETSRTPPRNGKASRAGSERGDRSDAGRKRERDRTPTQRERSSRSEDDEQSERSRPVKEKHRDRDDWVTRRKKGKRVEEGKDRRESSDSEDSEWGDRLPKDRRSRSGNAIEQQRQARNDHRAKSPLPHNRHETDPRPPPRRRQLERSASPRRDRSSSHTHPLPDLNPLSRSPRAANGPVTSSSNLNPRPQLIPRSPTKATRSHGSPRRRTSQESMSRGAAADDSDDHQPSRDSRLPAPNYESHDDDMTIEVGRNRFPAISTRTVRRETDDADFDIPWGSEDLPEDLPSIRKLLPREQTHDESDVKSVHAPAKLNKAETAQRLIDNPNSVLFKGTKRCNTCITARMDRECWAIPGKRARCAPCIRMGKACGFCETPAKEQGRAGRTGTNRGRSMTVISDVEDGDEEEDEQVDEDDDRTSLRNRTGRQIEDVASQISKALASVGTLNEMVEAIEEEQMTGMDKVFRNILVKLTNNLTKSEQDLKKIGRKFVA